MNPAAIPTFPKSPGSRATTSCTLQRPEGAQHLDAAIAWQSPFSGRGRGRRSRPHRSVRAQCGVHDPTGLSSGYGHVDVVNPAPGTWTAIIWTRPPAIDDTYTGPVKFSWAAELREVRLRIAREPRPGARGHAVDHCAVQDALAARRSGGRDPLSRTRGACSHSEIPIALRTLIPIGPNGGSFSGTLTGGNGRPSPGRPRPSPSTCRRASTT